MGDMTDWIDVYIKTIVAPCGIMILLLIAGIICLAFFAGTKF